MWEKRCPFSRQRYCLSLDLFKQNDVTYMRSTSKRNHKIIQIDFSNFKTKFKSHGAVSQSNQFKFNVHLTSLNCFSISFAAGRLWRGSVSLKRAVLWLPLESRKPTKKSQEPINAQRSWIEIISLASTQELRHVWKVPRCSEDISVWCAVVPSECFFQPSHE